MNILVPAMDDSKIRIRNKSQSKSAITPLATGSESYDRMILCKAVEDRICKKIDLASRDDLTMQQAGEALRLLLKIVRQNQLKFQFSAAEKLLLAVTII